MVGGRARSFTGNIPDESIYIVEFPERPGALRRFLEVRFLTVSQVEFFH